MWKNIVLVFLVYTIKNSACDTNFTACISKEYAELCTGLEPDGSVQCIVDTNVNCILKLEEGKVSFTKTTAESTVLASSFVINVSVVGILKPIDKHDIEASTEIIILINDKARANNYKNAKYCHPGTAIAISPSILNEFEQSILKYSGVEICRNQTMTTIENYISALNSFFGPSCRPGQWAADIQFDKILKHNYRNLTALCSTYPEGKDPFAQSLDCLTSNQGDIAVTTLEVVQKYLTANRTDIFYLCKNYTVQNMNAPCVWSREPWPMLLANKNKADELINTLHNSNSVVPGNLNNDDGKVAILEKIIFTNSTDLRLFLKNVPLSEYIQGFRNTSIPEDGDKCRSTMSWCTISEEEQNKCLWMRQAALNYFTTPAIITCNMLKSKDRDKYECIGKILRGESDITFIDSDQMYTAQKAKLKPLLYSKDEFENMIRTVIVVKSTKIRNLTDLKDKPACFSGYGDTAWHSFAYEMRNEILEDNADCLYDVGLKNYAKKACMPGVQDKMRRAAVEVRNDEGTCKLCEATIDSPTAVNCNANSIENLYADGEGALICLANDKAEYAVISIKSSLKLPENTQVMCKNGTLASSLEVDDECYLSVTPSGATVVGEDNKNAEDIRLTLLDLATAQLPFNIFGDFNGENNLLFRPSVQGFFQVDEENIFHKHDQEEYIERYDAIVAQTDKCSSARKISLPQPNSASFIIPIVVILIIIAIVAVAYIFWRRRQNEEKSDEETNQDENEEELALQDMNNTRG